MSLKIGISLTCYKRFDYLYQVLKSLKQSIEYSKKKDLTLYVSIDYFDEHILNLIKKIDWISVRYVINRPPVGCNKNTKYAMIMGLNYNDAIIHLEDDTALSLDAIDYFLENLEKYKDDPEVLCLGGYNQTYTLNSEDLHTTKKYEDFVCWGVGLWKHKSNTIINNWTPFLDPYNTAESWDTYINNTLFKQGKFYQVRPLISRIQNIGALDGTYTPGAASMMNMTPEHFHSHYQTTKYTSNDILKDSNAKNYQ